MTPAEAWADAQKYMDPAEKERLSKVINPQGVYNPGAGGPGDITQAVKTFQGLDDTGRGNFINSWDQQAAMGQLPAGSMAALQQALRTEMGKGTFDNWYAGVQNRQGSNIFPNASPVGPSTTLPGPGSLGPPATTSGVRTGGMTKRGIVAGETEPTGTLPPTGLGGRTPPGIRAGSPVTVHSPFQSSGGTGGAGPTGAGAILQRMFDQLRSGGTFPTGATRGGGTGTTPTPFGGGTRGSPPPAGTSPPPGGGTPPPGPGGPGYPPAQGPFPATWNGLPPMAFDPSWILRAMRQHYGAGGGAGRTYEPPAGWGGNWTGGNSGAAWGTIRQQGQPFNR